VQGAGRIKVAAVGCLRLCCQGPFVAVEPEGSLHQRVTPYAAPSMVNGPGGGAATAERADPRSAFFALQASVVLENSGRVEVERIESYIAAGGYEALYHVLRDMAPEEVVEEVSRSSLRGRGGAGYPTGLKWATVAKNRGDRKYVVCNADEGDPGAFMNRSVLESDPLCLART
jgi:bidirectional [NiFe] hydrogenase diaphorase subunit